jgi:hypothetical protein
MANPRICIAASPQSAACLHKQNTREGDVELSVLLAPCRESSIPRILFTNWHGENWKNVDSIILIAALEESP